MGQVLGLFKTNRKTWHLANLGWFFVSYFLNEIPLGSTLWSKDLDKKPIFSEALVR